MYDIQTIHLKVPNDIHQISKILIWSRTYVQKNTFLFSYLSFSPTILWFRQSSGMYGLNLFCIFSISSTESKKFW